MVKQTDPDFRVRAVRPSYSPSNRSAIPPTQRQPLTESRVHAYRPASTTTTRQVSSKPSPKQRYRRSVIIVVACLLLVLSCFTLPHFLHRSSGEHADAEVSNTGDVAGANTVVKTVDQVALSAQISKILTAYKGVDTGVSVVSLRDGQVYDFGDNAAYYAASVSKLISACDFLKQVQAGKYSLNTQVVGQPAKAQLEKLIVDSDNDAWQGFISLLGHPELEQFAKTYGVTFDAEQNTLNPHDTAIFLQKLYQGKIINQYHTKLLLGYMNRASDGQYLEANAPDGTTVYQKAGWLSDRLHVAGIVTNRNTGYVVAIYSKVNGTYDYTTGNTLIRDIQLTLNQTYF